MVEWLCSRQLFKRRRLINDIILNDTEPLTHLSRDACVKECKEENEIGFVNATCSNDDLILVHDVRCHNLMTLLTYNIYDFEPAPRRKKVFRMRKF